MGQKKVLNFMQLFPHYILFGENFIGKVKEVSLYSVCLNLNHEKQNSNQNVKDEKMVIFIKNLDHHHYKFNFGNFFSCPVKL